MTENAKRALRNIARMRNWTESGVPVAGLLPVRWIAARPAVLFLLWAFWLASEYVIFGQSSFVRIFDNGDSSLPALLGLREKFTLPPFAYWNPQWSSGVDILPQVITADLDSLPFAFLPGWLAYGLTMGFQRFIAGYFAYRLFRESLELDVLPAVYGALAYSLFSQILTQNTLGFSLYDHYALAAIPFILWAFTRLSVMPIPSMVLWSGGLGLLFAAVSTYIFAVFLIPLFLYWVLFLIPGPNSRLYGMLPVFVGGWLLGEVPVLWSTWLNASSSNRNYIVDSGMNIGLGYIVKQVGLVRNLVGTNIVSSGLLLLGVASIGTRDRRLVKVTVALLLSLGLVVVLPLFRGLVVGTGLQFLAGFTLERIVVIVPFLIVTCGAIGAQRVTDNHKRAAATILAFTVLMFFAIPLVKFLVSITSGDSLMSEFTFGRFLNLLPLLAIVFFAIGAQTLLRKVPIRILGNQFRVSAFSLSTFVLIGAIVFVGWDSLSIKSSALRRLDNGHQMDALYSNASIRRLRDETQSSAPFRVATITDAFRFGVRHPAYVWAYGLESADGYINMYPSRYKDYWVLVVAPLNAAEPRRYDQLMRTNRTYLYPPLEGFSLDKPVNFSSYYNLDLLSLANVRYFISPYPLDENRLSLYSSKRDSQDVYIYENRSVLPRFFLVGRALISSESSQVLESIGNANVADFRSTAYLSAGDISGLSLDRLDGQGGGVSLVSYSEDKIVLSVKSEGSNVLVITNNYSPFWVAEVGDEEGIVFPVNHAFQGVLVEDGEYEVVLEYRPPYAVKFR